MALDRDKYRRLFIDEAKEGLSAIERALVELEQARGDDDAAVRKSGFDEVFRHAHSLKGMAASLGFARFAHLAHCLEDLAAIGRAGRPLSTAAYDLLLQGCDVLGAGVAAVAGGSTDPDCGTLAERVSAEVQALRPAPQVPGAVDADRGASLAVGPAAAALPPPSSEPARVAGEVVLRVRLADDVSAPSVRAFVVHKTVAAVPGYLETTPPPEAIRKGELVDRTLRLRFQGGVDVEAMVALCRSCQGVVDVEVEGAAVVGVEKAERKDDGNRTIRVRTELLDELIDSVGEVLLARSRLRVLAVRLDEPELLDIVDEVERLTRELYDRVVSARMTPLSFVTERLPRVVRDLARQTDKAVDFAMSGTDIELDRAILDQVSAPLLHMVRNAVDHGHEGAVGRRLQGKSETMRLRLSARRDRDRVVLALDDDGKGLDPKAIRQRAIDKGLVDKAVAWSLSDQAALDLICLPGFSTVDVVTETSGRGVGMDVVRATVQKLGGSLLLSSTPRQGSRIELQLPLSVAIIQVLVVDVGDKDAAVAIPVARVERARALEDDSISFVNRLSFLRGESDDPLRPDALVAIHDLGAALRGDDDTALSAATARRGTVLMLPVQGNDDAVAFRVERILGQEEIVAKPLGLPLSTVPFIAGGAILADGRAAFVLEPQQLARQLAARARRA